MWKVSYLNTSWRWVPSRGALRTLKTVRWGVFYCPDAVWKEGWCSPDLRLSKRVNQQPPAVWHRKLSFFCPDLCLWKPRIQQSPPSLLRRGARRSIIGSSSWRIHVSTRGWMETATAGRNCHESSPQRRSEQLPYVVWSSPQTSNTGKKKTVLTEIWRAGAIAHNSSGPIFFAIACEYCYKSKKKQSEKRPDANCLRRGHMIKIQNQNLTPKILFFCNILPLFCYFFAILARGPFFSYCFFWVQDFFGSRLKFLSQDGYL